VKIDVMSVLTLEHVFDRDSNYHNISKYIVAIKKGGIPDDSFKTFLKTIENEFSEDTKIIEDIKRLPDDELSALSQKIKKFNIGFDQLNDLYYDKGYFNDAGIKQLFSSVSRQAHKIENTSHKYLFIGDTKSQAPDHIKEGLAKFSQETIGRKLTSEN